MSQYSDNSLDLDQPNTSWTKVFDYVPKNSRVLDVGCSSGTLGRELIERKDCEVYGIEIEPKDFDAAKKVLKEVFNVNLEQEPVPKELAKLRFDVIILADVIEHLVHPAAVLKVLQKLLSPKGKVVYSIPNMSHVSVRLQLLGGNFDYSETGLLDKTHLHFYDHKEVQRVFAKAGMQIEKNDATSLPYTRAFLQKKLQAQGLKDDGFIKQMMDDKNARTFQFVGIAAPAKDPAKIKPAPLSTTTPEKEFVDYVHKLEAESHDVEVATKDLRKQIADLHQDNAILSRDIQQLQVNLARFTDSLMWRTAKFISKPMRKKK